MLKLISFCFIALIFVSCNVAAPPEPTKPPGSLPPTLPDPPLPTIHTFQSVWDDFKVKNPIDAKKFDDISVKKFTETYIRGLDDVFKHVNDHPSIWKAIGLTDQDITRIKLFKKKIITENKPYILFAETSTPRVYFFDLIPLEGGVRGEVFYWFQKNILMNGGQG